MHIIFILVLAYFFAKLQKRYYAKHWNRNLEIHVAFEKQQVMEGEETNIVETVMNNKWLPIPIMFVNFKLEKGFENKHKNRVAADDKFTINDLINVLMKQSVKRKTAIICNKRGCYSMDGFSVKAYSLLLDACYGADYCEKSSIVVYPRTVNAGRFEELLKCIDGDLKKNDSFRIDPYQIRGCREYQSYDEMRYINWKATAKTGNLKVNVFDKISNADVYLYVNLECQKVFADEDVLEESIRLAKSFAIVLSDRGIRSSVITNGKPSEADYYIQVRKMDMGLSHLNRVDEALASIDLHKNMANKNEKFTENTFADLYGDEIVQNVRKGLVILISNSHEETLCSIMRNMKQQNVPFLWITPVSASKDFDEENQLMGNEYIWRLGYEGSEAMV